MSSKALLGDTVSGRTIDPNGVYQPGPLFFFPGFDSLEVARFELGARTSMRGAPRGMN